MTTTLPPLRSLAYEVPDRTLTAKEAGLLDASSAEMLVRNSEEVSRMLFALRARIRNG